MKAKMNHLEAMLALKEGSLQDTTAPAGSEIWLLSSITDRQDTVEETLVWEPQHPVSVMHDNVVTSPTSNRRGLILPGLTDSGPANEIDKRSHGTLVMSQAGLSSYLGPTAGSEWLRDVNTKCLAFNDIVLTMLTHFVARDTHKSRESRSVSLAVAGDRKPGIRHHSIVSCSISPST